MNQASLSLHLVRRVVSDYRRSSQDRIELVHVSASVGVADGLVVVGGWRVIDVSGVGLRGAGVGGCRCTPLFFLFFFGGGLFGVVFTSLLLFGGFFWVVLVLFCYCFATE